MIPKKVTSHSAHFQASLLVRQRSQRLPRSSSPAARAKLAGMRGKCIGRNSLRSTSSPGG